MPQIRLTSKAAAALKQTNLPGPVEKNEVLDDWCVDLFRVGRKSYFSIMHVRSRVAVSVGVSDIGGSANFINLFPMVLENFFEGLGLTEIGLECEEIFMDSFLCATLTKTDNRSLLAHMNQFKSTFELENYLDGELTDFMLEALSQRWTVGLVKIPESNGKKDDYDRPISILLSLLKERAVSNNVIHVNFSERA